MAGAGWVGARRHGVGTTLLDDALSSLEDGRAGVADLYFVGVAGDATEDAFRDDVEAAQRVMDERWGTAARSVGTPSPSGSAAAVG